MALKESKKKCNKCGQVKVFSRFFMNRKWEQEMMRDSWCKDCIAIHVTDRESLIQYCDFNQRLFHPYLWSIATEYCLNKYKEAKEYTSLSKDEVSQTDFIDKKSIKIYFSRMNMRQYYDTKKVVFKDPNGNDIELKEDSDEVDAFEYTHSLVKKTFNKEWSGFYTDSELAYLKEYFNGLLNDYKIDRVSHIDYAKKVCKASLAMDKAFSDMCDGKIGAEKKFKDLKDIFDQLSQSAKFAEKTRNETEQNSTDNLGDLIRRIENDGFLNNNPYKFEKDDIDKVIDDFKWTLMSLGDGDI